MAVGLILAVRDWVLSPEELLVVSAVVALMLALGRPSDEPK